MTKIIKRYSNRKLYDTEQSTYITLDEIQAMVKEGEDVRIIDNKSKEDITNATLAQIIFEQEKSHQRLLSLAALRSIIQSGEDFLQQKIETPVTQFREDVKRRAEAIVDTPKALRDFFETTQRSFDAMQRRFDDADIAQVRAEMATVNDRLTAIEGAIARIERQLEPHDATASQPYRNLPVS